MSQNEHLQTNSQSNKLLIPKLNLDKLLQNSSTSESQVGNNKSSSVNVAISEADEYMDIDLLLEKNTLVSEIKQVFNNI